jgi:hypothetical protein
MQDTAFVGCRKPRANLACYLDCLVARQASDASQKGGQVFAVNKLHRDEVAVFYLANVVNPADRRV